MAGYAGFLEALRRISPVPVTFEDIASGAKGYYSREERRIAVQRDMGEVQTVKTLLHEIAHADLHHPESEIEADRRTREVQAESCAFVVCAHYGIDTSDYSFPYLAGWSSGKELKELHSSLAHIQKEASTLIGRVDAALVEIRIRPPGLDADQKLESKHTETPSNHNNIETEDSTMAEQKTGTVFERVRDALFGTPTSPAQEAPPLPPMTPQERRVFEALAPGQLYFDQSATELLRRWEQDRQDVNLGSTDGKAVTEITGYGVFNGELCATFENAIGEGRTPLKPLIADLLNGRLEPANDAAQEAMRGLLPEQETPPLPPMTEQERAIVRALAVGQSYSTQDLYGLDDAMPEITGFEVDGGRLHIAVNDPAGPDFWNPEHFAALLLEGKLVPANDAARAAMRGLLPERESREKPSTPAKEESNGLYIRPVESLPEGWAWHDYDDGSGSLKSPDGKSYASYDAATSEYKLEGQDWDSYRPKSLAEFKNDVIVAVHQNLEAERGGLTDDHIRPDGEVDEAGLFLKMEAEARAGMLLGDNELDELRFEPDSFAAKAAVARAEADRRNAQCTPKERPEPGRE